MPAINLRSVSIDDAVWRLVPGDLVRKYLIVPVAVRGKTLTVATADPTNVFAMDDFSSKSGYHIEPVIASEIAIRETIASRFDLPEELAELIRTGFRPRGSLEELEEKAVLGRPTWAPVRISKRPEANFRVMQVYFATDRQRAPGRRDPNRAYTGYRSLSRTLQLGVCRVSVPHDHRLGHVERPSWFRFEFREDPAKHVVLLDMSELSPDVFYDELRYQLHGTDCPQLLVFVHGYNVSFAEAVRRTAQIAYDLDFGGAAVAYSWPSRGKVHGYLTDENNVRWSTPHLLQFLDELRARSRAGQIHVIAHSMGGRALTEALAAFATRNSQAQCFHEVVLAAPDIDADVFGDLLARFRAATARITMYASSNDEALAASKALHGGYARAGETEPDIVVLPGLDTVDASAVNTGLTGHSYYGENKSIISDMFYLLRGAGTPDTRFGMAAREKRGNKYWAFRP